MHEFCEHSVDKEHFCANCELRSLRMALAGAERTVDAFAKESLQDREKLRNTEKRLSDVEKRVQAAQAKIASRLKNCSPSDNPEGCVFSTCESFGCGTLRVIRDALKE